MVIQVVIEEEISNTVGCINVCILLYNILTVFLSQPFYEIRV